MYRMSLGGSPHHAYRRWDNHAWIAAMSGGLLCFILAVDLRATPPIPVGGGTPVQSPLSTGPYDPKTLPLASDMTVVLVLSTECDACAASMPFYKSLVAASDGERTRVVAVARDGAVPLKRTLDSHGFSPHRVTSGPYPGRSLPGVGAETPTLLVLNGAAETVRTFQGRLTAAQEREVLALLKKKPK